MLGASVPTKVTVTWGVGAPNANIRSIPNNSQIGVQAGAASFTDGFPPVCFLPVGAGGTPPFGQDFNGILRQVSQWIQWQSAGATVPYDSTFQTAVSGYPSGAIVQSAINPRQFWLNTVDGNTNNPDTGSYAGPAPYTQPAAGWQSYGQTTGDMKHRPTSEQQNGWARANANTIGNASSGATERANADCAALFNYLWTNFSNTQCPVSSGRGASAAADFAANKTIQLLDWRGVGPRGVDTMGGGATTKLSGVPITSGSATAPGSVVGENLHALIVAELAAHNHGITDPTHTHPAAAGSFLVSAGSAANISGGGGAYGIQANSGSGSTGITINNNGSGTAHNNVSLEMLVTWHICL